MQVDIETNGLPEALKALRFSHDLTQIQLADLLGVSRQAVSQWEAGMSKPSVARLWQIADLFGATLDELVGRAPEEVA